MSSDAASSTDTSTDSIAKALALRPKLHGCLKGKPPYHHAQTNEDNKESKSVRFTAEAHVSPSLQHGIDFRSIVYVTAGQGDKASTIIIHKNLLARSSPYLEQLLQPLAMRPGQEKQHFHLPDADPRGMNLFASWLYGQDISQIVKGKCFAWSQIRDLARAHVIGQSSYANIKLFRDSIVSCIIGIVCNSSKLKWLCRTLIADVYPIAGNTPLKQLCVDVMVWEDGKDEKRSYLKPTEQSLVAAFKEAERQRDSARKKGVKAPFRVSLCRYHEHGVDEVCCIRSQDVLEIR